MAEEKALTEAGDKRGDDPDPARKEPAPAAAVPPTLMLGYLDLSIRGVQAYERYARVYLSPWWPLPDLPETVLGWKRAVLERIPMRGAEHWGHLYLLVHPPQRPRTRLSILSRAVTGATVGHRPGESRITLRRGLQVAELWMRPTREDRASALREFGREVAERFRRQMD